MTGTKACLGCSRDLPLTDFYRHAQTKDGLRTRCKECCNVENRRWKASHPEAAKAIQRESKRRAMEDPHKRAQATEREALRRTTMDPAEKAKTLRRHQLAGRYNLTLDEWNRIWEFQGKRCAACKRPYTGTRSPHTEHRHVDGLIRGIVCHGCNQAIRYLRDSADAARGLAEFLDNPTATQVLGEERFTAVRPRRQRRKKRATRRKKA